MISESTFFDRLQTVVPKLAELRAEHERYNGELLGHVLMSEILNWTCKHVFDEPAAVDALLAEIAKHLQPVDDPVSNIISLSFLEGLGAPGTPPEETELRRRLPRVLVEEIRRMEAWRP